jgi:hypothetical protein
VSHLQRAVPVLADGERLKHRRSHWAKSAGEAQLKPPRSPHHGQTATRGMKRVGIVARGCALTRTSGWKGAGRDDFWRMLADAPQVGSCDSFPLECGAKPIRGSDARFTATVLAVVVIVAGIGASSYKGHAQHSTCFSTPKHHVAQPKAGAGRPPRCPVRSAP